MGSRSAIKPANSPRAGKSQGIVGPESRKPADLQRSIKACWRSAREAVPRTTAAPFVIAITDDSLRRLWTEHVARWCYYYEPARLEEISERLLRGRSLTRLQLEYLKDLKNLGDDLRNFFLLFSVVHQVPPRIQSLVKMVGQIRDQVRLVELFRAKQQAHKLIALLSKSSDIKWPALRTKPVAKCRFLRSRIAQMQALLKHKTFTAHEFHGFKKDFRLIYTVYYSLNPEAARRPADQNTLTAAKKLIKRMHQVLLEHKYKHGLRYRATLVTLPKKFRAHLLHLLATIKITSPGAKAIKENGLFSHPG